MIDSRRVLAVVLRISDVVLDGPALETALGFAIDRCRRLGAGGSSYAQIDVPVGDDVWGGIVGWVERIEPSVVQLQQKHLVGSTSLDFAVSFAANHASLSVAVPSSAANMIGGYGVDIEFSIYLTKDEQ